MNSFAPPTDWLELLCALAIETTLVFVLVVGVQRLTRSALWRRSLWQIAMLVFALLVLGELTGVGRGAALWVRQINRPKKSVSIPRPVVTVAPAMVALPPVESSASPVVIAQEPKPAPAEPQAQWWPTMVWLCGSLVVAGRAVLARLVLAIFQRRRGWATDASLAKRVQSLAARLRMSDQVRVLEAAGLASPIAFGLFRPAVGLPHQFAQTFTPEQQDVMLAHELAHLMARDPFWRLLADFVSAALWWHPLVWVARHQLHSATEAAADEASLVIADGPTTLAECLVELGGRLTRTSSIGWLGIQGGGYRSALARRVERLLKLKQQPWSPPSRRRSALAMITLPAALVIVALAATAWIIPKALRNSELSPNSTLQVLKQSPAGQLFFAARSLAASLVDSRRVVPRNDQPSLSQPASPGNKAEPESPRVFAANEAPPDAASPPETKEESGPPKVRDVPVPNTPLAATNLVHTSKGRAMIKSKLDRIVLSETPAFKDVALSEVVTYLREESLKRDPEGKGLNFLINPLINPHVDPSSATTVSIDSETGLPLPAPPSDSIDLFKVKITVPAMKDVQLKTLLDAITKLADPAIRYSVEDYAIVFSSKITEPEQLFTRTFRVDLNTLVEGLKRVRALPQGIAAPGMDPNLKMPRTYSTAEIQQATRDFFTAAGVDFKPPSSRQMFFSYGTGMLMVRATLPELEIIELVLQTLSARPSRRVFAANEAPPDAPSLPETKKESGPPKVRDLLPAPDSRPLDSTNLIHMGKGSERIASKLKQIVLSETPAFKDVALSDVVKYLREESIKRDPAGKGLNFLLNPHVDSPSSEGAVVIDPNTGLPLPTPPSYLIDLNKVPIAVPALKDVRLEDLLNAITKSANPKIKCWVEPYAVVFSLNTPEPVQLFTRTFRVNPNTFLEGLKRVRALPQATVVPGIDPDLQMPGTYSTEEIQKAIRDFLTAAAVDFKSPSSRALFYNDRTGILMVRAPLQELESVASAIEVLNYSPPQVTIEVKVCELTEEDEAALGFDWFLGNSVVPTTNSPSTNTVLGTRTGILTDPQFRVVIRALEQRGDTNLLAAPRVTTLGGRQAQIKVTNVKAVVTGVNYQTNKIKGPQGTKEEVLANYTTSDMDFGPTVDVTPTVSTNGWSIQMNVNVQVNEFLGYDAPPKTDPKDAKGQEPLPRYRVRQLASNPIVWDGQTIVLSGGSITENPNKGETKVRALGDLPLLGRFFRSGSAARNRKNLVIFVTPTIIDPAGNPIHAIPTLRDLPFDPLSIPPQAPAK